MFNAFGAICLIFSISFFIFGLCASSWNDVETTDITREELVITNVFADTNFSLNYPVSKWNFFTSGPTSYSAGMNVKNPRELVFIYSTVNTDGVGFNHTVRTFDLKRDAFPEIHFFTQKLKGTRKPHLVIFFPNTNEIPWYKIEKYELEEVWSIRLEHTATHLNLFKINKRNFVMIGAHMEKKHHETFKAIFYEFDEDLENYWFSHSIKLSGPIDSSAISYSDGNAYLSLTQKIKGCLQIFLFEGHRSVPYLNVESGNITQVISFENGFKSFLAINGGNPGIFEFTKYGLEKSTIINSNIEGLDFWLPIPIQNYRDETVLLIQRTLDHQTHKSSDFDMILYNGVEFQEHEDISCTYFGEHTSLKCLGEYQNNLDINNAGCLSMEDNVGLLIPNIDGSSLLFLINSEIRPLPNPEKTEIDHYLAKKEKLEQLLNDDSRHLKFKENLPEIQESARPRFASKSQDALKNFVKMEQLSNRVTLLEREINELNKNLNKIDNNKIKTYRNIVFNAPVKIETSLQTDELKLTTLNDEDVNFVLEDIVTQKNLNKIESHKTFMNLEVENIHFENVNGIPKTDFILKSEKDLFIDDDIRFVNKIDVQNLTTSFVNNVDVKHEWIDVNTKVTGPIVFDNIEVQKFSTNTINRVKVEFNDLTTFKDAKPSYEFKNLSIPGNITVENINGENLEDFLSKLCLNTVECFMPKLKVLGNVTVFEDAETDYLNEIKYPENFVLSESLDDEDILIEISGSKKFSEILRGYKITNVSSINNVNPNDFVTINTKQNISGEITFHDLELKSVLDVNGIIKGKSVDKILQNLNIEETSVLKSNVEFFNLEVLGNIIIEDKYGNTSLKILLNDIISKDQELANINSTKRFLSSFTVLKNLHVNSLAIDNIEIKSIVTKNGNEELKIEKIYGVVDIENLTSKGGLFGVVNITHLNETLVKITESNNITSVLIFEQPLEVNSLEIQRKLNDLTSDQYLFHNVSKTDTKNMDLGNIFAENLIIEENFKGNIINFNIEKFFDNTLKYSGDQTIEDTFSLSKSILQNLKVENINGVPFGNLFSCTSFDKHILNLLSSGKVHVDKLFLNRSVNLETMTNINFSDAMKRNPWRMLQTNGNENLIIEGNVYFDTLNINQLASENFDNFVQTLIFKDDDSVVIKDTIAFVKDPVINKLLETKFINDIAIENILRNDAEQVINGELTIYGNVTLTEPTSVEKLNEVSTEYLEKDFRIDGDSISMTGDVIFKRLEYVNYLELKGLINDQNFTEVVKNTAKIDGQVTLERDVIFKNDVKILGNLSVSNTSNDINLNILFDKIVWTNRNQTVTTPVQFLKSVEVFDMLNIEERFYTKLLFNSDLKQKIENAVFVHQGLLKGNYTLTKIAINEMLTTQFLNNVDLSTIIPLKTAQAIEEDIYINRMTSVNDIKVSKTVNSRNLEEEVNNTKLVNEPQTILSEVIFSNNVLVEGNITVTNINNKPADKIVDLNSDQILTGSYKFDSNVWVNQDVEIVGLINGINISRWNATSLRSSLNKPQILTEDLKILKSLTFKNSFNSMGFVDDLNLTVLQTDVETKTKYKLSVNKGIRNDYANLCTDVTYIYNKVKNQIYKFKYFEKFQQLVFPSVVHYVKYFKFHERNYIFINGDHCFSDIMEFRENAFQFRTKVKTGKVEQIVDVRSSRNDTLYLVSRHEKGICDEIERSTVVWELDNENSFRVVGAIENQDLLQDSLIENTFYGLKNNVVTEFKVTVQNEQIFVPIQKWKIKNNKEKLAFMPRGLKTGLSLRADKEIIFLKKTVLEENENSLNDPDTENYFIGNYTVQINHYIPGKDNGEILVANVGANKNSRNVMVVSKHRETKVQHKFDLIEIYTDVFSGELFDQIQAYKPSSIMSINFENGETLLSFLEDKKLLQIYEYKGIEGFKHKSTIRIAGSSMFLTELPIEPFLNPRKVIGVINGNKITLIEAVMSGNKIKDNLNCSVPNF